MTSKDELREKVQNLNVYKAAVNMHKQYRPDQANLQRFSASWEEEILNLLEGEKQKAYKKGLWSGWGCATKEQFESQLATLNKEPNKGEDVDG